MDFESIPEKTCTSCKLLQPTDNFHYNRTKPDGRQSQCKNCCQTRNASCYARNRSKRLAQGKEYRNANREHLRLRNLAYKQCNREKLRADAKARYREKSADILLKQKQRRDNDLDSFRAIERSRYWGRPEAMRAYRRAFYKKDALAHCQRTKAYQQKHPHRVQKWKRDWIARNPEKRRIAVQNNSAMRRRSQGRFSLRQLLDKYEYHGWRCYLCGTKLTLKLSHPDHRKPLSRGGTNWIANIAPACIKCNLRKNKRTEAEYRALLAV